MLIPRSGVDRWLIENLTEEVEMELFVMEILGSFNSEANGGVEKSLHRQQNARTRSQPGPTVVHLPNHPYGSFSQTFIKHRNWPKYSGDTSIQSSPYRTTSSKRRCHVSRLSSLRSYRSPINYNSLAVLLTDIFPWLYSTLLWRTSNPIFSLSLFCACQPFMSSRVKKSQGIE